ncbi:MAG: 5'/3'-nucleotidase SurE [Gammaproteobacteria bacterium]|nr:MAG: 5'/3'-nucleotidase SurE [Gammaproteobacteria bacterium]
MRILISNDDGIEAPGIQALFDELINDNDITLVAPDRNRSATSAALTLDIPLRVTERSANQYSVNGTPCDCVHLGTHRIMQKPPEMVIAGINRGANLGDDVLYSGTVAAAMEGRSLGYTSVAISLASHECTNYKTAAKVMLSLKNKIAKHPLAKNIILNVNIPDLPFDEIKGIRITRLGSRHRKDTVIATEDPRGNSIYWFGPPSEPEDTGEMTDFKAINEGYVSITPLTVDLTHFESLNSLSEWMLVD